MNIGVFSPSSRVDPDALNRAKNTADAVGLHCHVHDQSHNTHHQSAGHTADKVRALQELMTDEFYDAVWASNGGNRSADIMPHIDTDVMALKQLCTKPLIGYSDVTYLLNALYALTGQINVHGPCLQTLDKKRITDGTIDQLKSLVTAITQNKAHQIIMPLKYEEQTHFNPLAVGEHVSGVLVGGNLSMIQSLIGTKHMPQDERIILFIEDVGDQLSRYDRMLRHIKHAGIFDRCAAVLIGDLSCAEDQSATAFGFSVDDILQDNLADLKCPVYTGLPFGHRGDFVSLPIGAQAKLGAPLLNKGLPLNFFFRPNAIHD